MKEKVKEVCDLLNDMGIDFKLIEHKAVFTMEEMLELDLPDVDSLAKNLFVRDDKKRNYYLLVLPLDKKVELKILKEKINSRPLSFASENDLNDILGLSRGSVTPLGIINDKERKVKVIIDKSFKDKSIAIHPNDNTASIWLDVEDLVSVIEEHGNSVDLVEI